MKQHDVKKTRTLGGNTFFIRPFGAFKSANLSGEVAALLTPIIAAFAPVVDDLKKIGELKEDASVLDLDIDMEKLSPSLGQALSGFSGDRLESLLKKLLVQFKNISVEIDGRGEAQLLTEDLANELFCGETQNMFILLFDVIKVNYSGFFEKLGSQFGKAADAVHQKAEPSLVNTGTSM